MPSSNSSKLSQQQKVFYTCLRHDAHKIYSENSAEYKKLNWLFWQLVNRSEVGDVKQICDLKDKIICIKLVTIDHLINVILQFIAFSNIFIKLIGNEYVYLPQMLGWLVLLLHIEHAFYWVESKLILNRLLIKSWCWQTILSYIRVKSICFWNHCYKTSAPKIFEFRA